MKEDDDITEKVTHHCTFCGKNNTNVQQIVMSPDACICNECIEICRDIIGAHRVKNDNHGVTK